MFAVVDILAVDPATLFQLTDVDRADPDRLWRPGVMDGWSSVVCPFPRAAAAVEVTRMTSVQPRRTMAAVSIDRKRVGRDKVMTVVEVGNNERLSVEPRRDLLRLYPAIAGARIELQYSVATVTPNPTVSAASFYFTADLYASRVMRQQERMVCRLTAESLVAPIASGAVVTLIGFISGEQLREIEALRVGEHLHLRLVLAASTTVDGTSQRFRGDEYVTITPGEWATELTRVDAATVVEVLVPMPTAEEFATATRRIREARDLLRNNDVDAAMGAARLALEAVRSELGTLKIADGAPVKGRDRTQEQRNAVLVEAAFSVLSGAIHDDDLTKTFRYTRTQTATMIALVAGLVKDTSENL